MQKSTKASDKGRAKKPSTADARVQLDKLNKRKKRNQKRKNKKKGSFLKKPTIEIDNR